jgi:hypothetical protein
MPYLGFRVDILLKKKNFNTTNSVLTRAKISFFVMFSLFFVMFALFFVMIDDDYFVFYIDILKVFCLI